MTDRFPCGPLELVVATESAFLRKVAAKSLTLFDAEWPLPRSPVNVRIEEVHQPARMVPGNYLALDRMNVDLIPSGLRATCILGSCMFYGREVDQWVMQIPREINPAWHIQTEVDDLLMLILTVSWRKIGWVAIHAGCITRSNTCAMLAASSGAGKTTLVVEMIRH
jgi:hypothetical protein